MKNSYLVQRLRKPFAGEGVSSGPFAFGGGMRDGGLSADALELFKDLFRFDYMGSAEFEFGDVPRAFQKIAAAANRDELVAGRFTVKLSDVQPHWDEIPKGARSETKSRWPKTREVREVFYLCSRDWEQEVESRVRGWASARHNSDLKEETLLAGTLRPHAEFERDGLATVGWLELDNGFMFFTDEKMWQGTCELFGVSVV